MDNIESTIKAVIETEVIKALNAAPEAIDKLVKAALSHPVSEHGLKPDYRDTPMPYLEWLVGSEIRKATAEVVKDYVETHKDEIKAKVQEAMQGSDIMAPVAETVTKIMSEDYRWQVNLNIDKN